MASKKDKRFVEEIDYTDWVVEYDDTEANVNSLDSLIREMEEKGTGPMQAGRLAFVGTQKGDCVEPILRHSSKYHLNVGLAQDVSAQVAAKAVQARLKNGKEVKHREYVGRVLKDNDAINNDESDTFEQRQVTPDDFKLVKASSEGGVSRAIEYMRDTLPGYVRGRLVIIAAHGTPEAVKAAADELKATIDNIVAELI